MAKYGINKEGVQALNQLANDLGNVNKDIEDDGKKLKNTISALGDKLGIYEAPILELVENINSVQEKGKDSIQQLSATIRKKAIEAEELVNEGF